MTVYRRTTEEQGQPWYYDFQLNKVRYQGYCLNYESGAPARSEKEARDIEGAERRAAKANRESRAAASGQVLSLWRRRWHCILTTRSRAHPSTSPIS